MIKVGITGQSGFIGYHLTQMIKYTTDFKLIPFEKSFFDTSEYLDSFVIQCDTIVHLAAVNRHEDNSVLFKTNIELSKLLIEALRRTKSKAHVIMSSSKQEEMDNMYGKSKIESRKLFKEWSVETGNCFNSLLIPNVFGPFGKPFYNSVVATFCHQICRDQVPIVLNDSDLNLIFVGELVSKIIDHIKNKVFDDLVVISATNKIKVSELLNRLINFKFEYLEKNEIPKLNTTFDLNLFNTFRAYIVFEEEYPRKFLKNVDTRGAFVELIRLNNGGQVSFSTTVPGITRGEHFHTRKIERFAVIKGKALIQLRQIGTKKVFNFELFGDVPSYVDMPIWFTHNIKNIGNEELLTVFWINEFYNQNDPDTYFETV